jgi:hypothetical protein
MFIKNSKLREMITVTHVCLCRLLWGFKENRAYLFDDYTFPYSSTDIPHLMLLSGSRKTEQ